MRLVLYLGLALGLAVGAVSAAIVPKPGAGDPHIQTVDYDPEQVVSLRIALGYALTLEFAPDERIENVAVGNSAVWQVTPNKVGDHLFIKPMQGASDTNMTVITNGHSYNFELKPLAGFEPTMAYAVRFLYPAPAPVLQANARTENTVYRYRGSRVLRPSSMSDDGRSTTIAWPPKASIPAVFTIDAEGRTALLNGEVRDGRYVIDEVHDEYLFRLGGDEAHATRRVLKARPR